MKTRQLAALFACDLVVFSFGIALLGLLPIYATRLGADSALTGYYLAFAFLALAIGGIVSGWLSDKLQRRRALLVACGAASAPATWLMGLATDIGQLAVLTATVWFFLGVVLSMVGILAGLSAPETRRGQVFGVLGLAIGIGGLIGGVVSGPIVDRWGYQTLFTVAALGFGAQPLIGLFLEEPAAERVLPDATPSAVQGSMFSRAFWLLFAASVMGQLAGSSSTLARPLIMDQLRFDATAVSSTVAVGSAITIPLPLLVGWLSDRFGRRPLLAVMYFVSAVGMVILLASVSLWHFWAATALLSTIGASSAVGLALVADLVPRESLGAALSVFGSTTSIAFVLGSAGTGQSIRALGMSRTLLIAAILPLIAIFLLRPLRRPAPAPEAGSD